MEDKNLDVETIDAIVTRLYAQAQRMHDIYIDETEEDWAREEAYDMWRGYREAAEFVAALKESLA